MFLTVWATVGLVIWIGLWSIGAKGFDAFMLTVAIILIGVVIKMVLPYLPGTRQS